VKFLVTGGAGFIGSHIVDALIDEGHKVLVIDNESSDSHEEYYKNPNAEYKNLDIAKYRWIKNSFENIDVVFHLAAESKIQSTIGNPQLAVQTNILGTCNILQAARENGVKRIIMSSTAAAYGLNNIPNTEDMQNDCLNPYAVTKVAGEELCKMYSSVYGLETVIFRYFNVYGARQPIRGPYVPVIGKFLDQKKNHEPLTIVPDGTQRRDFIHVSDVVEANMIAAFKQEIKSGEIINVGTGTSYSIKEIADMISDNQRLIEPRPTEIENSLSDINKAKNLLLWKPKVELEDWINQQKELL